MVQVEWEWPSGRKANKLFRTRSQALAFMFELSLCDTARKIRTVAR
jgi:hypothetical protein